MIKAAIYGAGAMGGTLGALIEKSGGTIDLYARNPAHVAAVRKRGLTLRCSADQTSFTVRPAIFTPEEMPARTRQNGRYDVIFLMTKQRDNEKIVTFLKDFLSGNGVVVTTQNGLPEESVAKIVGAGKTFGGVCSFGANFTTPGEAELTSTLASAKICIGAYAPPPVKDQSDEKRRGDICTSAQTSEQFGNIRALLQPVAAITNENFYRETENLAGVRYAKLIVNAAFSSLSAATGLTFGEIAEDKTARKLALGIMRETLAVASAQHISVDTVQGKNVAKLLHKAKPPFGAIKDKLLLFLLPKFVKNHKNSVSGMLLDIRRGRRCEIDYIAGAVSAAGIKTGVRTPLCDGVVRVVRAAENGEIKLCKENCGLLLDSD